MNGERDGALEAAPDNGDTGVRTRSGERRLASVLEEAGRADTPSIIAEEDETLYTQYLAARIPPAVPYMAPDDLPVPGDNLSDPDLPYWLALNRVKGIGPARGGTRCAHDRGAGAPAAYHRSRR